MKVLIVGSSPPAQGEGARALGALAAQVIARGDDVEVLAPEAECVAHHYANLRGLRLCLQLALRSRHVDELVVRVQVGLPLAPESSRGQRALALLGLGAALGLYRDVTIRLDSPVPIPGGLGGRATDLLWRNATRIVVANEEDRAELLLVPKVAAGKVLVEPAIDAPIEKELEFAALASNPSREEVLAVVRARAQARRSVDLAVVDLSSPKGAFVPSRLALRPSTRAVASAVFRRARRAASQARRR